MRRAFSVLIVFTGLVIGLAAQGQQTPPPGGQKPAAPPPKNLQVLPKDMTTQQLTGLMRRVAGALGVDCTHCHVSMTDRASDDKAPKLVARKMFKMTMAINDEFLKDVGEPAPAGEQKVTCYTCHRGALKPLTSAPAGGGH
jgi:hypothetical protein